jgi:hypothetical protein
MSDFPKNQIKSNLGYLENPLLFSKVFFHGSNFDFGCSKIRVQQSGSYASFKEKTRKTSQTLVMAFCYQFLQIS